jgi:DNA-binding ferritin-like protein
MFGWMILASLGVGFFKKDPYPFTFLLFLSNLVQLFALPILAVGQQVLSRASDIQAEQTYKDAEAILKLQDQIHSLIKINNNLTEEIHQVIAQKK